ncbi:hypothetical protein ACFSUJ_12035 [Streptomyces lusitanus]|uniref:Uncharacterized protein n=1 Tax=Streptomyces lusitanus TaxID=68232 RepID=A0ABU3JP55_9ACTN|nr:hypothetical protein [Streptomyces lusitanus]
MHLRRTAPSQLFVVSGGGAGLVPELPCEHGLPSVSLHLFSQSGKDIGIVLPTCAAAQLFGAVAAFLEVHVNKETADEFVQHLTEARAAAALELHTAKQAAEAACCEAGLNSQGREHTCHTTPSA